MQIAAAGQASASIHYAGQCVLYQESLNIAELYRMQGWSFFLRLLLPQSLLSLVRRSPKRLMEKMACPDQNYGEVVSSVCA